MDPQYLRDPNTSQQSLSPGRDTKTPKTATPDEADTQDIPQPAIPSWRKDEISFAEQRARQLHLAIWRKNLKAVAGFLESRVDPSKKPPFSRDLLFVAAQRADASMVKLLLDNGKNLDIHSLDADNSALAVACFHGKLSMVEVLVDHGADIDLQYTAGSWGSALAASIFQRNTATIQFLLNSGADPNLPLLTGRYGSTLIIAVCIGDIEIVEALLAVGANVNMILQYGEHSNALAAACSCENEAMVEILLKSGANPDEPLCDDSGYLSCLLIAAHRGNVPIYTLLQSYGATSTSFASFLLISQHVSDIEGDLKSDQSFEKIGIKTAELVPNYSEVEFTCELSFMAQPAPDIRSWLSNVVILARKHDTVQLTTVKEFLTAPESYVLDMVLKVLENKKHLYVNHFAMFQLLDGRFKVTCHITANHILDTLRWLFVAARKPKLGALCYSESIMEANPDGPGEKCTLSNLKEVPLSGDDNLCWRGLFDSAIIAVGPEIKGKPLQNIRGLELDFNVMLQLSAVEYPVMVGSGLVLIGYSTALIPIRRTNDGMIMWHLEVAKNDFQIKIADIEAIKDPKTWLRVEDLNELRSHRGLLGWCSASDVLLGTNRLATDVTWSNAKIKATSWHWKGANLQLLAQSATPLQIGGQAGMSFDRTINTIQFSPSGNYLKCLRSSALVPIILYDVTAKRAWFVSLLSVLHHMLLVYCDSIDKPLRGAKAPIATSDGSNSSLEALSCSGGKTVERSGQDSLTIRELIMGFSVNLSKASLQKPKKSTIYGYEFMDIVMDSTRSELKKTTLEKEGLAWTSLLNEVNCLFCSNLGEAIVGRVEFDDFPLCNTLPPSLDYMAASVQSLKALSKRHGGHIDGEASWLSQSCYLQLTGSPFQSHHGHANSCWENVEFLQEIQTSQPANKTRHQSLDKYLSGALVFGKAVRTKAERLHDFRESQVDVDSVVEEKSFKKHIMLVRSE